MNCPECDQILIKEWYDDLPYLSCDNGHSIGGIGEILDFIISYLEEKENKQ